MGLERSVDVIHELRDALRADETPDDERPVVPNGTAHVLDCDLAGVDLGNHCTGKEVWHRLGPGRTGRRLRNSFERLGAQLDEAHFDAAVRAGAVQRMQRRDRLVVTSGTRDASAAAIFREIDRSVRVKRMFLGLLPVSRHSTLPVAVRPVDMTAWLGSNLARMEIYVLLEEMARRIPSSSSSATGRHCVPTAPVRSNHARTGHVPGWPGMIMPALMPPSTSRSAPVTNALSSDAKNSAASATSDI